MRKVRKTTSVGLFLASGIVSAWAADPTGDWRVADGVANIRIAECNGSMWGVVAWEKTPGGRDSSNPDVSKRNRPTLGMPILLGMSPRAGAQATWNGQIYNSEDGRTYDGRISLTAPDKLRVEGCVLGFLCGGEDWHRVSGTTAMAASGKPKAGITAAVAKETPARVCSEVLRRH